MSLYQKGSEWRKWDLHLHTPSSYDYGNKSINDTDIIDTLERQNISVAAITDHHVMDVERIKALQALGKEKNITIFPGIEFLSDSRGSEPIHFIGIFPEDCDVSHVWGELKHKTNIANEQQNGKKENEIYCSLKETSKLIHELNGIVTIHAGSKSNSLEKITNSLPHAMAQKTDIVSYIDIFELGKSSDQKGYIENVFPTIKRRVPMIICSDNHNSKKYKVKENCWIKADPTFNGLKRALDEPENRIFIGEEPPLLGQIANNRTKYIQKLSIKKIDDYTRAYGVWFEDINVPINNELVAIIGNKGSGKSAISDIISICSNYCDEKDFSFLTTKKFLSKSGKIAKNFQATITWGDGSTNSRNLNDKEASSDHLKVKYLAQGTFERLTNEISTIEQFQKEIETVVFSHIPESERLGTKTFEELIEKRSSASEDKIVHLKNSLSILNKEIIKLEKESTAQYETQLKSNISEKLQELKALEEPQVIADPNIDLGKRKENAAINETINKIKERKKELEESIENSENNKKDLLIDLENLKTVKSEIEQKQQELKLFKDERQVMLDKYNLDLNELMLVKVDLSSISSLVLEKEKQLQNLKRILGEIENSDETINLKIQLQKVQQELKEKTEKLNVEQKKFQKYLIAKELWEKEKKKIIGSKDITDSLVFYEDKLKYITNNLKNDLNELYEQRREYTKKIFQAKQEGVSVYKSSRERLNKIIESNSKTLKEYKITIDASLVKAHDFSDNFLRFIDKAKSGSFYSSDGAEAQLNKIFSETNFDQQESVLEFLGKIIDALKIDQRTNFDSKSRNIFEQVKNPLELYDFLFSLSFLDKNYQLKQGDKTLDQLSPGERGALLLVFYLLLDKSNLPLIIDQPEDNLDNSSVATILVPFIKDAKQKRQIIMVTHNPNLAVVADAEQIIYVNIDKRNHYTFSATSGSIENERINQKIVDVLEGALPAFDSRRIAYQIGRNSN